MAVRPEESVVGANPGRQRAWLERPAHEVALRVVAAERSQHVPHRQVLDALGDHLQPEVVPEVDGRTHDGRDLFVGRHARDERPVDLQLLHRQFHDVGERGVTGAVVVDRQFHAELGESIEHLLRVRRIFHESALGDLQAQQARGHVVFGEQLGHVLRQLAVHEIARRDVHRYLQRQALAQPLRRTGAPPRAAPSASVV